MGLTAQQKQLICEAELSALVYGRGEDFLLIRLDTTEPNETFLREIANRGLILCGVFALINGEAMARLSPDNPFAPYTASFASVPFARIAADYLRQPKGDSAEWLTALHTLEDSRNTEKEN